MDDSGAVKAPEGWLGILEDLAAVEKGEGEGPKRSTKVLTAVTKIWQRLLRESEEQRRDDTDSLFARVDRLEKRDEDRKAEMKQLLWDFEMLKITVIDGRGL